MEDTQQSTDAIDEILSKLQSISTTEGGYELISDDNLSEARQAIEKLLLQERQDAYKAGWRNAHKDMHDTIDWGQRMLGDKKCDHLSLLNKTGESVMKKRHEWKDNDTWSVFKCKNCPMIIFAPHKLPEYGCSNDPGAEQIARIK